MTAQPSLFDKEPRFCIDTNVILSFLNHSDAEYYGSDIFVDQWKYMLGLMKAHAIVAPGEVERELARWATALDGLRHWLDHHKPMFIHEHSDAHLASAKKIVNRYPVYGSVDNYLCDLDVMTLADAMHIAVLTLERPSSGESKRHPKIPNVCREFGIDCVSVAGFLRRERLADGSTQ